MLANYLERTERYTRERLIPFWASRIEDTAHGGLQPGYDGEGRRSEVTDKAMLAQARGIMTISHARRLGWAWPDGEGVLRRAIDFLFRAFRDPDYDGYYWMTAADGRVLDDGKVVYGHSFLIYAFAEHALLTGDALSREEACRLFSLLCARAADLRYGGFYEHFDREFRPIAVRSDGIIHKSLDVHMHLMEAFTSLYELTGDPRHRQALEQVTALIFARMTDPATGCGIAMFRPDWTPIPNVQLGTLWGADRFDPTGKPPEITSYGHDIELAWLYLHSLEKIGSELIFRKNREKFKSSDPIFSIFRHTAERGVDWDCGGLYVEGPRDGAATETHKEFWQQAEALVGFLDAYKLTGDELYLNAFKNVHDFVFTHMIAPAGEWYPLLDRRGAVLRDALGYHWKIGYHTVRGMVETVKRLREIVTG
ncbi:MAG: AGE family epimerase/isomerase [Armatimonadota bacterium]